MIEAPSPNFDARRALPDALVLHYTGMRTGPEALARLCDPEARVSTHYVVEEDGRVFRLVDEARRAWHAGRGVWQGQDDLNGASIGIEIVNPGHEFGAPRANWPTAGASPKSAPPACWPRRATASSAAPKPGPRPARSRRPTGARPPSPRTPSVRSIRPPPSTGRAIRWTTPRPSRSPPTRWRTPSFRAPRLRPKSSPSPRPNRLWSRSPKHPLPRPSASPPNPPSAAPMCRTPWRPAPSR